MYWLVANRDSGDFRCDFITSCVAPAKSATKTDGGDFSKTTANGSVDFRTGELTKQSGSYLRFIPHQDESIESDEKIYIVLCETDSCVDPINSNVSTLLDTAYVTIVGERVWADNVENRNTSTVALKADQPVAASFTTGSDSNGYQMNNVKLKFGGDADDSDTSDDPGDVSVRLFRDATLTPGCREHLSMS